ncbi:MAG: thioredoxin family protein [Clostridia bacterium]|nr:thioredoxin family protein [Clostridia bacterium]NCC45163.1 thioredoxin family protein [Clostridia bacterium]
MGLFGKKKEKEAPACACNGNAPEIEAESMSKGCGCGNAEGTSTCCEEAENGICCMRVLGSGCKSCHELYENAQKAVNSMGISVEVEYVTDMEKVVSYGVMSTPALVVNEKVVSMGKVLKPADVEKLLRKLGF